MVTALQMTAVTSDLVSISLGSLAHKCGQRSFLSLASGGTVMLYKAGAH